jgi:ribosomal protein S18 acetylase RimI-like enzyme
VDPRFRRRGIGRALFAAALEAMREARPELEAVTVNSSDFALPFYRSLGFLGAGPRHARKGMRITPLLLPLTSRRSR